MLSVRLATISIAASLWAVAWVCGVAQAEPSPVPCSSPSECAELSEWHLEADALEAAGDFRGAARAHEQIAARRPNAHSAWRAARALARLADLEVERPDERVRLAEQTLAWADRGLFLDPGCAECRLYRLVGLGHIAAARGGFAAAGIARELVNTLVRCLEDEPTFVHANGEDERANLYYAAAIVYRSLPESRMTRLLLGARGDKLRALSLIRRAHARSPQRLDYSLELAASLLCVGHERGDPSLREEGLGLLARIPTPSGEVPGSVHLQSFADQLRARPSGACGVSRESVIAGRL
ncbi:MAG: hypothetical protein QNK05_22715 [Myxococcota bacterium]|nr:hypothetical protein [Myxococcota bacterium]